MALVTQRDEVPPRVRTASTERDDVMDVVLGVVADARTTALTRLVIAFENDLAKGLPLVGIVSHRHTAEKVFVM